MNENISNLYDVGAKFADSIIPSIRDASALVKQTACEVLGDQSYVDFTIQKLQKVAERYESIEKTHTQAYKGAVERLQELEACSDSTQAYLQRAGEKAVEGAQKIGNVASDIVKDNGYQAADKIADVSSSDPTGIVLGIVGLVGAGISGMVLYSKRNKTPSQKHYDTLKTSSAV